MRILLPDSGHAALLEREVDLSAILKQGQAKALQAQEAKQTARAAAAAKRNQQLAAPPTGASLSSQPPAVPTPPPPTSRPLLSAQGLGAPETSTWNEWAQRLAPWRDLASACRRFIVL